MELADPAVRAAVLDRLGDLFRGRKVICGTGPLAGFTEWVALLRRTGALRPLVLATGRGAGAVPTPEQAEIVMLEAPSHDSMTEELAALDGLLRHLPRPVRQRLDGYDPGAEALWLVPAFVDAEPVLGRAVVGGRPRAWSRMEDKLWVDRLWDAVGQPRAPCAVLPLDPQALREAAGTLDAGHGTVWAGDGFNGGGERVRWVRTDAEAEEAYGFFTGRATRLRVMPFLEGVPCSVHGLVLPDGTAALRPVELAILRDRRRQFVYGGQGTTWSPPAEDREAMRSLVRRVGEHLRAEHGYRGAFGIDGVLTERGFRPTELNPRFSGGLTSLARASDPQLLQLLHLNAVAGRDPGVPVADLERWLVPLLDARPFCRANAVGHDRVTESPVDLVVRWDGTALRRERSGPWVVETAPTPVGLFARLTASGPETDGLRAGLLNVALMELLDAELGTRFGPVLAAPDVRAAAAH